MFQTDLNLFLQSLATPWLTFLMKWVSQMGYVPFYVAVIGAVMFALDLRRGFVLAQLLLVTNLVTDVAKWSFAMPRPSDVDAAVIDPRTGAPNPTPWRGRGARSFFGPIDAEALAEFRSRPDQNCGFPSGHTSTTVALWGGLAVLFRRRFLVAATAVAVPLMMLSRMYLGRHFLGDVLGGLALGAMLVAAVAVLVATERAPAPVVRLRRLADLSAARRLGVVLVLAVPPLALLACGDIVVRERIGQLLGLDAAFLALALGGVPEEAPGWLRALGRAGVALSVGLLGGLAVGRLVRLAPPELSVAAGIAGGVVAAFLLLWGTVAVARRLGLYRAAIEG